MRIRTRFAPSPTGFLHLGGARTALFSWLYARRNHGEFVLRIEDTDKERSRLAYAQAIMDALQWLGLDWDGEPVLQSSRFSRYQDVVNDLRESKQVYFCYCLPHELEAMRAAQKAAGEKPRYDGRCRRRSEPRDGVNPVVRLKTPQHGTVRFTDEIKGEVVVDNRELDDMILLRADGSPTYNLTAVVDDWDLQISHVIRGDDHLNNTMRQLHLYRLLQAPLPRFAHLPLIRDESGKRLSKRDGAADVNHYRSQGYCPEAVLNYLLRLGWSHGNQEIFSRREMIDCFDLAAVHASPAATDLKKLRWFNQHYLKNLPLENVQQTFADWITQANGHGDEDELVRWLPAMRMRCKTLAEMAEAVRALLNDELFVHRAQHTRQSIQPGSRLLLEAVRTHANTVSPWQKEAWQRVLSEIETATGMPVKHAAPVLRLALCAGLPGPGLAETIALLGRTRVSSRLQTMIALLQERRPGG